MVYFASNALMAMNVIYCPHYNFPFHNFILHQFIS